MVVFLTEDIAEGKCEAAYSRQLAERIILRNILEKNYGDQSFIKTKDDIKTMGLNTFFFLMHLRPLIEEYLKNLITMMERGCFKRRSVHSL